MSITTAKIHEVAKACGIKNLKAKGRTAAIILEEIVKLKGWVYQDEATLEYLMNGGEVTQCRDATTDKPPLGNQSSAGKSKRKGKSEFAKRADQYKANINTAMLTLNDEQLEKFQQYLSDLGLWPITGDTKIWGLGGLCEMCQKWGLPVKYVVAEPLVNNPIEAPKEKVIKEPRLKGEPRAPVNKDGLISLSSLCEKYGVDGKVARRKLRGKMDKPEAGWHFTPAEEKDVVVIITK